MEKTIYIDEKPVRLRSTAALPKLYKAQYRRDYFADMLKLAKSAGTKGKGKLNLSDISFENLEHFDMEMIYDVVWTMAKAADPTIPDPITWLDGFETFPIGEIMPEIQDMLTSSVQQSKKK
nr:MAG TPA: tail assembly chaperone protein [Caudoviricetes sp.]